MGEKKIKNGSWFLSGDTTETEKDIKKLNISFIAESLVSVLKLEWCFYLKAC